MAVSKQLRVPTDPEFLKPVIEALIFASEEPLSPRALIRLLSGDRDGERDDAAPGEIAPEENPAVDVVAADAAPTAADPVETPTADESSSNDDPAATGIAGALVTLDIADGLPSAEAGGTVDDLAGAMESAELRFSGYPPKPGSVDQAYLRALIDELNGEYLETGRAFRIVEVAGGFQFATVRDYGEWVALLSKEKSRRRLSPAALETLAIVAYRQPASKPEIESIRGVNCDQVLVNLMEKNLIAISGRSEGVGRPLLYSTTDDFLRSFGLKGIGDLPKLREIEELMEEDAFSAERVEVITLDADTDAEEIEARVGAAGHHVDGEDGTVVDPAIVQADLFAGEHHPIELVEEPEEAPTTDDVAVAEAESAVEAESVSESESHEKENGVEAEKSVEAENAADAMGVGNEEDAAEAEYGIEDEDVSEAGNAADAMEAGNEEDDAEAEDAIETVDASEAANVDDAMEEDEAGNAAEAMEAEDASESNVASESDNADDTAADEAAEQTEPASDNASMDNGDAPAEMMEHR